MCFHACFTTQHVDSHQDYECSVEECVRKTNFKWVIFQMDFHLPSAENSSFASLMAFSVHHDYVIKAIQHIASRSVNKTAIPALRIRLPPIYEIIFNWALRHGNFKILRKRSMARHGAYHIKALKSAASLQSWLISLLIKFIDAVHGLGSKLQSIFYFRSAFLVSLVRWQPNSHHQSKQVESLFPRKRFLIKRGSRRGGEERT